MGRKRSQVRSQKEFTESEYEMHDPEPGPTYSETYKEMREEISQLEYSIRRNRCVGRGLFQCVPLLTVQHAVIPGRPAHSGISRPI